MVKIGNNNARGSARLHCWLMWLLLAVGYLLTHFHRVNLNVLADCLMDEFSLSGVSLGNLVAAYSYMFMIFQIPGGIIIDRFGSRRVGFVTFFLMGIGSIIFGCSSTISGIFVGRLLIGLGGSVIFINVLKFQSSWFRPNEFATMSGLSIFVGGLGSMLATFPLAFVITYVRWPLTFLTTGVVSILLSIICLILVKDCPENAGVVGDDPAVAGGEQVALQYSLWQMLVVTARNKVLWPPLFVYFGIWGSFFTFTGAWGVTCMMQIYHVTRSQASLIVLPALLGLIVGGPSSGYLSDRLGSRKKIAVIAALLFWANWSIFIIFGGKPPLSLIYVMAFNLGVTASTVSLILTYTREISPPDLTASSIAFVNVGTFAGAAALQLLFGYILQQGWEGAWQGGVMFYPLPAFFKAYLCCFVAAGLSAIISIFMVDEADYKRNTLNLPG